MGGHRRLGLDPLSLCRQPIKLPIDAVGVVFLRHPKRQVVTPHRFGVTVHAGDDLLGLFPRQWSNPTYCAMHLDGGRVLKLAQVKLSGGFVFGDG